MGQAFAIAVVRMRQNLNYIILFFSVRYEILIIVNLEKGYLLINIYPNSKTLVVQSQSLSQRRLSRQNFPQPTPTLLETETPYPIEYC